MTRLLALLLFVLTAFPALAAEPETAYDRVMRTNTLRCAYLLWPPVLVREQSTGALSGVAYDIMEEIGRRLSLKIEWTEEAGTDVILQGLQTGRYDTVCFPLYANSARSRVAFFTAPLYYSPAYIVTRADDARFDKNYAILNDPSYSIAFLEGEITAILAHQRFPKAQRHAVPQIQGYSFVLKDVGLKKADATISDPTSVKLYNANNPEKLKMLSPPVIVSPIVFATAQDPKLKEMLSTAVNEIVIEGWLGNTLETKYPDYWSTMLPVAQPYEAKP